MATPTANIKPETTPAPTPTAADAFGNVVPLREFMFNLIKDKDIICSGAEKSRLAENLAFLARNQLPHRRPFDFAEFSLVSGEDERLYLIYDSHVIISGLEHRSSEFALGSLYAASQIAVSALVQ